MRMKEKIWIETNDEEEPIRLYWRYYIPGHRSWGTKRLRDPTTTEKLRLQYNTECIPIRKRIINRRLVFVKIISTDMFDEIMSRKKTVKDKLVVK